MISYKTVKDLITNKCTHLFPREPEQRKEGRGHGKLMGFSGMWAGVQKEVEPNQRTKSNRKGHIRRHGKLHFRK